MNNKQFNKLAAKEFDNIHDEDVDDIILALHQMGRDDIAINICFNRGRLDLFIQIKELRLCSKQLAARPWTQN